MARKRLADDVLYPSSIPDAQLETFRKQYNMSERVTFTNIYPIKAEAISLAHNSLAENNSLRTLDEDVPGDKQLCVIIPLLVEVIEAMDAKHYFESDIFNPAAVNTFFERKCFSSELDFLRDVLLKCDVTAICCLGK